MSNLIPGNQKHLTLDNRIFIEKSLDNNLPFKVIAKYLCKDPTTVSKEVKKHRSLTSRNNFVSHNHCVHRGKCGLTNVCKRTVACKKQCRTCNACNTHCDQFKNEICSKVLKAPFVCNGCSKKAGCRLDKYFYKATQANRQYKTILVESRNGINISEDSLNQMDAIVTPLILQGRLRTKYLKIIPK
ncbi:helix-turn-helix domain-containing protein [Ruminiclostridium josui]|uniref:helix-turn-helix domain-containing protein n=1 Tax=Ruminiclostridium josui TaxID=1499 RepID=UPI0004B2DF78|nr:helix-turn-helix domain-containing protein [Ruminiclostridium josui]